MFPREGNRIIGIEKNRSAKPNARLGICRRTGTRRNSETHTRCCGRGEEVSSIHACQINSERSPAMRMLSSSLTRDRLCRRAAQDGSPPIERHAVCHPHRHHPGYFRTLQLPLLQGRDFNEPDYDAPNVLIVSKSFANRHWPHESAIGKSVRFDQACSASW